MCECDCVGGLLQKGVRLSSILSFQSKDEGRWTPDERSVTYLYLHILKTKAITIDYQSQ